MAGLSVLRFTLMTITIVLMLHLYGCQKVVVCDPTTCSIPDCFCPGRTIPGGLTPKNTPQMVVFTFHGAVNDGVYAPLMELFGMDKNRTNPNGCPIGMTLFVTHNSTNYCTVAELYRNGHEVASNSKTHKFPIQFWAMASYEEYEHEIEGHKAILSRLAGIPQDKIIGYRSPFLQPGGDVQFRVLKDRNFTYDSSLLVVTRELDNRMWPYTLDVPHQNPCGISPCPSEGYPGLWELPIQPIPDHTGILCSSLDQCEESTTADEVYGYMMQSFNASYHGNRGPLILNMNANWFNKNDHALKGFRRFIDELATMKETYIITSTQLIEWMRKPTPLSKLTNFEPWKCNDERTTQPCSRTMIRAGQNKTKKSGSEVDVCDPAICTPPDCFCAGHTIPGRLTPENTPQMVVFTFNGAVNDGVYAPLMDLFGMDKNRTNPNGCPIGMTLFVTHNSTNYCTVAEFYRNGHEVASNSKTHKFPIQFWAMASYEEYNHEIGGHKAILSRLAGIPMDKIIGYRSPFIQPGGDVQFRVLKDRNFTYDSSLLVVTRALHNRMWPYTLDFPHQTPCNIGPCPSEGYPGLWELPIQPIPDHTGTLCSFLDQCEESTTVDEIYGYMMQSFNASYHGNRGPLILNMNVKWFNKNEHALKGFRRFIDELATMKETYIITSTQLIEWMRKPTPLSKLANFDPWKCNDERTTQPCTKPIIKAGQNKTKKYGSEVDVCDPNICTLPDCFCAGHTIPGRLTPENTPQMVLFTFNGAVNNRVYAPLMDLFGKDKNRTNPNGCPIGMTLFVTHDDTNYCTLAEFYRNGHEVASNSITHKFPIQFWATASYKEYKHEINGHKAIISRLAGIPQDKIIGYRSPFIQPGGDTQFRVLKDQNFTYDSSLLVWTKTLDDRVWPYTLDVPHQTPCEISPCPSEGYPGLWELPIQAIPDHTGTLCSFLDQCEESTTADEVYGYMMESFNASYHGNRGPLIFNMYAYWFNENDHALEGFRRFIDELVAMKDTYIITPSQLIEWMRKPTPLSKLANFEPWKCDDERTTQQCSRAPSSGLEVDVCDSTNCSPPECFCAGRTIPGGLTPDNTPQMVVFTFDDAVNYGVYASLMDLFGMDKKRTNPNGCPIGMTLFVTHNETNYCTVAEFYRNGHEVASHSVSHRFPIQSWATASYKEYDHEIYGQKDILSRLAGIPKDKIIGYRSPFIQPGGDTQFRVLKDRNFMYDSSLLVWTQGLDDRVWPYTLDVPHQTPCSIGPCPSMGYPGLWELPIQPIPDHTGNLCSFHDRCKESTTADEVYGYMMRSFNASYHQNRGPLILNMHAIWFKDNDHTLQGFRRFIDKLITMKDTYIITSTQLIEWMRKPTPLSKLANFEPWNCNDERTTQPCSSIIFNSNQDETKNSGFEVYTSKITVVLFAACFVYLLVNKPV